MNMFLYKIMKYKLIWGVNMGISLNEIFMYKNFNELAMDILDLAKEIMPDSFFS